MPPSGTETDPQMKTWEGKISSNDAGVLIKYGEMRLASGTVLDNVNNDIEVETGKNDTDKNVLHIINKDSNTKYSMSKIKKDGQYIDFNEDIRFSASP